MVVYGKNNSDIDKYTKISQEMKTNNSSTINWQPYMQELEQTIKNNWIPYIQEAAQTIKNNKNPFDDNILSSKRTVARFIVNKNGELSDIKILKTSGIKLIDDTALNALQKTNFKPLPEEFNGEAVPVEFTFDYNVIWRVLGIEDRCKTKFCKFMQKY